MKLEKRKHKYLIGYMGENQCAYGRGLAPNYLDLMTFTQAKRELKGLESHGAKKAIYELVPIAKVVCK